MYVNLELDRASCLHRFKDVYAAMGIVPNNLQTYLHLLLMDLRMPSESIPRLP